MSDAGNVCELDIIFNFHKAYYLLDELVMGGELQETNKKEVRAPLPCPAVPCSCAPPLSVRSLSILSSCVLYLRTLSALCYGVPPVFTLCLGRILRKKMQVS